MKKSMVLSAAVLMASFSFCPILHAEDALPPLQQQAGQLPGQVLQDTQQKGKEAAARQDNDAARQDRDADQMFARHAAADNAYEIQLAQYVEQQAQNPQVKELAHQIIQDHQQAQQQLQQIASEMNVQLSIDLEPWQQAKLDATRQKHGEHLEREFAFGEVGDHHADILCFEYEAQHGQNTQMKDFAQQTIPALEKHLQLADDAAGQWVSEPRSAAEHIRGAADPTGFKSGVPESIKGTDSTKVGGATESPNNGVRSGVNTGVNR